MHCRSHLKVLKAIHRYDGREKAIRGQPSAGKIKDIIECQ